MDVLEKRTAGSDSHRSHGRPRDKNFWAWKKIGVSSTWPIAHQVELGVNEGDEQ